MSQNSQKGKNPAPPLGSENDASTLTSSATSAREANGVSFATRLASSARGLARDVLTTPTEDGVVALASMSNGKVVPGSSSSSSFATSGAESGEGSVARAANATTTTTGDDMSRFRTPRLGDNANVQAEFDSFLADDGRAALAGSARPDVNMDMAMSHEQMQAEMQKLHESWHRGWSRHPGDIERGSGSGSVIDEVDDGRKVAGNGDVSVMQARDGNDVVALLGVDDDDDDGMSMGMGMGGQQRTGGFYKEEDLQIEIDDAKDVDASDLFPSVHPHPYSQAGDDTNATRNAATNTSTLTDPNLRTNPTYNFLPLALTTSTSTSQNTQALNEELWFRDWERVLTSYADDVWDPSSFPWVVEARESLQQVKESSNVVDEKVKGGRERALERLRMVVGHIRVPDALVGGGRGGGGSGGGGCD